MKPSALGLGVLLVLAAGASLASAGPPAPASGTGEITTSVVTSVRTADGNVITEFLQTGTISGTLSGTFVETVRVVQHADGRITFHGAATLTGSAEGCGAGTIPLRLEGTGLAAGLVAEGRIRTARASENTAGVEAVLTFEQAGATFTYAGTYMCVR